MGVCPKRLMREAVPAWRFASPTKESLRTRFSRINSVPLAVLPSPTLPLVLPSVRHIQPPFSHRFGRHLLRDYFPSVSSSAFILCFAATSTVPPFPCEDVSSFSHTHTHTHAHAHAHRQVPSALSLVVVFYVN